MLALAVSWLGITIGESLASVSTRMGDPVATAHDPQLDKFVYLTEDGNAFVTAIAEHGMVSGIRLWSLTNAAGKTADTFGITLGTSDETLKAKRGKPARTGSDIDGPFEAYQDGDTLWLYHLRGDQSVSSITLSTSESALAESAAQPLPAVHSGRSRADAIRVVQPDSAAVQRFEQMYLAIHPCPGGGTWHIAKTVRQDGVDVVSTSCNPSGAAQTWYFTPEGPSFPR